MISEVKQKLITWIAVNSDIPKIIDYLIKNGYINEERFCRAYINDKYKYSKWGINKIKYSLKRKNIDSSTIDQCITEVLNIEEYDSILYSVLKNKGNSIKYDTILEYKNKLFRFAASRGYNISDINKTIDILIKEKSQ